MATVIKPIKKYRRTSWRKKYLTQSQRWGKVVITKMPIPQGDITTSEILSTPAVEEAPKKEYKITFTRHSTKSTVVSATSEEEATEIARFRFSGNQNGYDELVKEFDVEIEEL